MEQTRVQYNQGDELNVTIKNMSLQCIRTLKRKFGKKKDAIAFANLIASLNGVELGQIMVEQFKETTYGLSRLVAWYKPNGKRYYKKH